MSDEVHNYRDVMYRLSNRLSKEEAQDIALLNKLEHNFHEERQFMIFVQLEQRQIISESSPEKLVQILRKIDRKDLAKEADRLNVLLKKSRKKNRGTTNNCVQEPTPEWKSAEFAVARMHIEHLAASLINLDPDCDQEIKEAVDKLKGINKHLSRAERCKGLPPTARQYIKSLDLDDDISTCSSSNNSENCFDAELPAHEEEPVYEVMTYGRPSQSQTSVSNPDKIDSRPPQPAPKPKPSRGLQECKAEEEAFGSSSATPTPIHKIPLLGMVPTASVLQHHHTPSRSLLLTPGNTRTTTKPLSYSQDDNTGDSGMGTGSGEYGFNNVQRYLKVSPGPSKRQRPIPPPKPKPSVTNTEEYMPLRTTNELSDYTQLQTPRSNIPTTEQIYYSTPTS